MSRGLLCEREGNVERCGAALKCRYGKLSERDNVGEWRVAALKYRCKARGAGRSEEPVWGARREVKGSAEMSV